mmetsp:Transcript_16879/g.40231  ORF Transcript_16879/g.40231 Transcript_16879/m.40231 type:complete len:168 (-) Transcript_16879:26-529(-)
MSCTRSPKVPPGPTSPARTASWSSGGTSMGRRCRRPSRAVSCGAEPAAVPCLPDGIPSAGGASAPPAPARGSLSVAAPEDEEALEVPGEGLQLDDLLADPLRLEPAEELVRGVDPAAALSNIEQPLPAIQLEALLGHLALRADRGRGVLVSLCRAPPLGPPLPSPGL